MDMPELSGKTAIITGGGSGIGKAIAEALAGAGASAVIADINAEFVHQACSDIERLGVQTVAIEADITQREQVELIFERTLEVFGRVDILVNNAGTTHPAQSICDLDLEYVDRIFELDFKGLYLCCRQAGPIMTGQASGCIINISSMAGITPLPLVMYGPMKSAVNMLTRILAREWADTGVRVNAVAPGYVMTPLIQGMISSGQRDPKTLLERIPMHAMMDPEDIARACVFLASADARFI
ncbi:MAG TPA: SDR family oxidoreductase, partial [Deltaproteobacteria bacterium]|nr:SDR family oxidoreductase [Deltaproteobacteria bacterium]